MDSVKKDLYNRVGIYGAHDEDPVPEKVRRQARIYRNKGGKVSKHHHQDKSKHTHKEY